ncbi:MAG: EipA family protein [Pseudomonadota bacterium]
MTLRRPLVAIGTIAFALASCETIDSIGNDPGPATANYSVESQVVERDLDYPTYEKKTLVDEAENAFGQASAEIAEVIDRVFDSEGRPQAYIAGEEAGGAFGVGLAYGRGYLYRPDTEPLEIFWQGPSLGFDLGGDASKVFVLVYNLGETENIFRRYPGGGANLFFVGGVGAEAMTNGQTTVVPIRTGVGARSGIAVEYIKFSRQRSINPF